MFSISISILLLICLQVPVYAAVTLNDKVQHNFGIHSEPAVAVQSARQWQASAQVLDASSLVSLLADLEVAQEVANASGRELQRVEALHKENNNVSLKTVEAARAQAISDSAHIQVLQAQLLSGWGAGVSKMPAQLRKQLMQAILTGQQVLVRADLLTQTAPVISFSSVRLKLLSDDRAISAKVLGSLSQTQGQSLGKSYLLVVSTNLQSELLPGQLLTAELQDATHPVQGIQISKSAVVRWQGQYWAYLEQELGHYQRVSISVAQWLEQSVIVSKGIKAGDKVVASGAGLILGAELSPQETEEEKED